MGMWSAKVGAEYWTRHNGKRVKVRYTGRGVGVNLETGRRVRLHGPLWEG